MYDTFKSKLILLIVLSTTAAAIMIWFAWHLNSQDVVINFKNSNTISVYTDQNYQNNQLDKPTAVVGKNSQKLRLTKGSYVVTYKGEKDYEDGYVNLKVGESGSKIVIKPFYAPEKLDSLLDQELALIVSALKQRYPNLAGLYTIQRGVLYHYGDWYGTTLQYQGDDYANSDTLRVVLRKNNSKWEIETDPPHIYLAKSSYKKIPTDILNSLNNDSSTQMLEKFTSPDISHGPGGQ